MGLSLLDIAFNVEVLRRAREWERKQTPGGDTVKDREEILEENSKDMHRQWLDTLPPELRAQFGG